MSIYLGTTKLADKAAQAAMSIDNSLSGTSTNPVENQAVFNKLALFAPYIQQQGMESFAGQSEVDAGGLLEATGDLHPFVLDVSGNTGLKKLTAKGRSGHVQTGLTGVLVSPEAPFDSTTAPQLDVSYTGLNRAALVNLFNSMPYNVGYEVVGSPTITDGVAGGFSSSDYVRTSAGVPAGATSLEILFKFNRVAIAESGTFALLDSSGYTFGFYTGQNNNVQCYLQDNGTTVYWNVSGGNSSAKYIKVLLTAEQFSAYESTDGINFSQTLTRSGSFNLNWGVVYFGANNLHANWKAYSGAIDLNESYIKVNGNMWFKGSAARQLGPTVTRVGELTIRDGVASGFSSSDYVTVALPISPDYNLVNGIEMQTRLKVPAYSAGLAIHYLTGVDGVSSGLSVNNAGKIYWLIGREDTSNTNIAIGGGNTTTIQVDTFYYVRLKIENNIATLYTKTDTSSWIAEATEDLTGKVIKPYYERPLGLGHAGVASNNNYIFNGSLDLNNTYIKVNGTKIFAGMVSMSKTCSVVGCSGTEELTAEDKAIATGKGWELTVA